MKRYKILLIAISSLALLTGCSTKYINTPCPRVVTLSKVGDVNITTNGDGGLDADNTLKIFRLVYRLREVERYYHGETIRLDMFVKERNEEFIDG